jgi:hypothetical protein
MVDPAFMGFRRGGCLSFRLRVMGQRLSRDVVTGEVCGYGFSVS